MNIIGNISTFLVATWTIIQIIQALFKPKEKLCYSYKKNLLFNSKFKTIYQPLENNRVFWNINVTKQLVYNDALCEASICDDTSIVVHEYEFVNTGKVKIEGNSFYTSEKLGLKSNEIICATINDSTPDYINPSLKLQGNKLELDFEVLDPKDKISISIITRNYGPNIEIIGKTNKIKQIKPVNYISLKESEYYDLKLWEKELLIWKDIFNRFSSSLTFGLIIVLLANEFIKQLIDFYIKYKIGGLNG